MIAIDIPMPKSCLNCRLCYGDNEIDYYFCAAIKGHPSIESFDGLGYSRPSNCPLIEVTQINQEEQQK